MPTGYLINSATSITATAPAGSAGTVHITVTTPGGISATSASDQFTYITVSITSFTPATAAEGGTVTFTGTGLNGATSVSFGGVPAYSFTVNSDTQITAVVAYGASGNVQVVTPISTAQCPGFTYTPSAVYTFNHLSAGVLTGQDNWTFTPIGTNGNSDKAFQVLVPGVTTPANGGAQNDAVTGQDGSPAARFPFGGSQVGGRASRLNNSNFSLPTFSPGNVYVIEFEMAQTYWGTWFGVGYDANSNGSIDNGDNSEVGVDLLVCNNSDVRQLKGPNGTVTSGTAALSAFNRYQIVIDRAANGGAGSASVMYKDLTVGSSAWTPIAGLQNVAMGFTTGAGNTNPANWNGFYLRSESNGPTTLFDNITVRQVTPSARSISFGTANIGSTNSNSVSLSGLHLSGQLTATLSGDYKFSDNSTTKSGVTNGTNLALVFSPSRPGTRAGTLTLQGDDMARRWLSLYPVKESRT